MMYEVSTISKQNFDAIWPWKVKWRSTEKNWEYIELIYNTDLKRLVSKIYLLSLSYIVIMQSCSTK